MFFLFNSGREGVLFCHAKKKGDTMSTTCKDDLLTYLGGWKRFLIVDGWWWWRRRVERRHVPNIDAAFGGVHSTA